MRLLILVVLLSGCTNFQETEADAFAVEAMQNFSLCTTTEPRENCLYILRDHCARFTDYCGTEF